MRNKYFFPLSNILIFIWILALTSCATSQFKIDKTPLSKHFATNPVFNESHTGLLIYDPDEKAVVFDYNSQKHFTPASNTKLLTYFASINMLGDSIPSIKYSLSNDTLYFTGTGDPTLLYDDFNSEQILSFLQNHGKVLAYIEKPMADSRFGPGWAWDDYPYYYSAEKSSFPIYGNMVKFQQDSSSSFVSVIPPYFEDHLSIVQQDNVRGFRIDRDEFANQFVMKFNKNPAPFEESYPFIYSNQIFVELLSDTIGRPIISETDFPLNQMKTLYSCPVDSVVKQILIESDNFLAEQMLLLISDQLGDTLNSRQSIEFIKENYLSELKDEIHWVDGSGLSRYNQITPHAIIKVLEHIYQQVPSDKLFELLPSSGATGTLKNSFPNLAGHLHAKTGSMSHVYNLSGYLKTKSGKTLLFSFMNNNFNVSFSELKAEMERVLALFVNDIK